MDPFKNPKSEAEEKLSNPEVLEATEMTDSALDEESGLISGEVSEIAKDGASENKAHGQGSKGDDDTSNVQKEKKHLEEMGDRMALRERLLAAAPKESAMRSEVKQVLLQKKASLESDVKKYSRKQNYRLLSDAVAQLRLVVHQLQEIAEASYEALKEVWLKVVHKFA
ncbi:MAG: hypothetical protein WC777_05890 [Candidatus Gracilibacteria bacterium]|jgi:hypothetical protein